MESDCIVVYRDQDFPKLGVPFVGYPDSKDYSRCWDIYLGPILMETTDDSLE